MNRRSFVYKLWVGGAVLALAVTNVVLLLVRKIRPTLTEVLPRGSLRLPATASSIPATPSNPDQDISSIAFSLLGNSLASGNAFSQLAIWNLETQQSSSTWSGPPNCGFIDIGLCSDNSWLATISPYRGVKFWTPGRTKDTGEVTFKEVTYNEFSSHPTCLAFLPPASDSATRSPTLVAVALTDNSIRILKYDPKERELPKDILALRTNDPSVVKVDGLFEELVTVKGHTAQINAMSFSHDGTLLASASDDHTIQLWGTSDWQRVTTLQGHGGGVNSVSFSNNDKSLASASNDHTIMTWDLGTMAQQRVLRGHMDTVLNAVFCGESDWLVSTSFDRSIMLWPLGEGLGKSYQFAENPGNYAAIDASANGRYVASSWGREVRFWKASDIQSEAKQELGID